MNCILVVDGGHTRTRAALVDESGTVITQIVTGPIAPYYGEEDLNRSISQVLKSIRHCMDYLAPSDTLSLICCGMTTGGESTPYAKRLRKELASVVEVEQLHIREDFEMSLLAASGGCDEGVIVLAGGGAIAYGRWRGKTYRAGGWGSVFGDEGSGLSIGLKALNAVSRATDQREPPTLLKDAVLQHFAMKDFREVNSRIFAGTLTQTQIADLTPLVADCAASGDEKAIQVLNWAAKELVLIALSVIRQMGIVSINVYVSGGVFHETRLLYPGFCTMLKDYVPSVTIHPAQYPPLMGCVLFAFHKMGVRVDSNMGERIADELQAMRGLINAF